MLPSMVTSAYSAPTLVTENAVPTPVSTRVESTAFAVHPLPFQYSHVAPSAVVRAIRRPFGASPACSAP